MPEMGLIDWLIEWLMFYGTSTQDRSICANPPGGLLAQAFEDSQRGTYKNIQLHAIQWMESYKFYRNRVDSIEYYVYGVDITIDVFKVYTSATHESGGKKWSFSLVSQLDLHSMLYGNRTVT